MSIQATTFHLFPELPPELRERIWMYCLPSRICELDLPDPEVLWEVKTYVTSRNPPVLRFDHANMVFEPTRRYGFEKPPLCELHKTTRLNGCPPAITRVCHEARSIAFKAGGFSDLEFEDVEKFVPWGSDARICPAWFDPGRDSMHLNCTGWYGDRAPGSALCCLYDAAKQCRNTSSLMAMGVDGFMWYLTPGPRSFPPFANGKVLDPEDVRHMEGFQKQSAWRVVMRTFVIHCDLKEARKTALFGLLGDAPVQLVDVEDQARMKVYLDMAKRCEKLAAPRFGQDFTIKSLARSTRLMRQGLLERYKDEEIANKLHAVVMFRLCPVMCNYAEMGDVDGNDRTPDGEEFEWRCSPHSRPGARRGRPGWRLRGRLTRERLNRGVGSSWVDAALSQSEEGACQ